MKIQREPYKYAPHSWGYLKAAGRNICNHCGLVRLKNDFTEWCVKMGCNNADHPGYKAQRNMKRE
jgi:hypothetical protein